jgi:N-dimethylarginine dimethylaminohydrolase
MRPHPRILMCPPDYYGIEYEINPWMRMDASADPLLARRQWENLVAILRELGATIERMEAKPGLPDMVFTANAGIVHQNRFIPSRFRHPQRQGESPWFEAWFRGQGLEVVDLYARANLNGSAFEGAGDALFCGETLVAGYLNRSDIQIHRHLAALLACRVVSVELVDPYFYHLDTCFCPLAAGRAIYFPAAFDSYAQRALSECVGDLVTVDEADARRFGCNAVVVGESVVIHAGCDRLGAQLRELGFDVHATDLSEYLKSGGSAKCLTLRLDGEESAAW